MEKKLDVNAAEGILQVTFPFDMAQVKGHYLLDLRGIRVLEIGAES